MILNMSNLEGEETFDPSHLGQAEEVMQERVSDDELIFIKGLIVKYWNFKMINCMHILVGVAYWP